MHIKSLHSIDRGKIDRQLTMYHQKLLERANFADVYYVLLVQLSTLALSVKAANSLIFEVTKNLFEDFPAEQSRLLTFCIRGKQRNVIL